MRLPLVKGTRIDSNAEWRDAIPVNMTAFNTDAGGSPGYLRTTDGLKQFATGFGIDRGGYWSDRFQSHVRVSGDRLIEVGQFGDVVDVGSPTVIGGSAQVEFDGSFNSIAFTANGDYYRYDPVAGTLTTPTKPTSDDFIDVTFIDGYYVFTDGENLWNTDLSDETTFNPTNRAGSDFAPDDIVAVDKTSDNKLIVFNRYTTERFYNAGGAQFPFARIPNAAIPIGIVGTQAKARIGDGQWVVFGGSKEYSPAFYLLTNSYTRISNEEIDSIIDDYSDFELRNIKIEFRDSRDQSLVICHLPRDVLVYDISYSRVAGQPIWYTFKSGIDSVWRAWNGVYDPRNVDNQASAWIYGDKLDDRMGKLDKTICTQYGEDLFWECRTPLVRVGGTVKQMEVLPAPGHEAVNDPKIMISTTKDGVLFGQEILTQSGGTGLYNWRIFKRRLGDYPNLFGLRIRGYSSNITSLSRCEIE